jgi:hypothetical protein
MWQWQCDDSSWQSYQPRYSKAIEKKYKAWVTERDKPQRVFVNLDVGHGEFAYQFDFSDPFETPPPAAAADAPAAFPMCITAAVQTNQKSGRGRDVRRCTSSAAPALVAAKRRLMNTKMSFQQALAREQQRDHEDSFKLRVVVCTADCPDEFERALAYVTRSSHSAKV